MAGVAGELRRRHPGLTVTAGLDERSAPRALTAAARADLVVTGHRAHGPLPGLTLGSVTSALAARARRPFVVVRGERTDPERGEIVLAVGPGQDRGAIRFAFERAARQGSPVFAVRAWNPASETQGVLYYLGLGRLEQEQHDQLEALLAPERRRFPEVGVSVATACEATAPALLQAAKDAQLLVLGTHRRRDPSAAKIGSTVHSMLVHSPVPVALVPVEERAG